MTHKDRILSIIFTILVTVFALIPIYEFKKHKNIKPQELYRVYLNGKSVGLIKSKSKLNDYINEEQKELKEKYNVDTVYVPKSLYISKYNGYDDKTMSEEELYKLIKDKEDFTIKGYKVIIETESGENIELNVLNKEEFKNSINTVVRAFVDNDELEAFLSGEEVVLKGVGKKIEDVYIKENIKIKEAFIPSSELILPDEKEITKYLLFGDEITEKYYTVKAGDTIESIAEDNKLAVEELLVVNQNLKSKNSILSIGQEVSVALISPVVTVVEEEHSVEEQEIAFTTEYEYDGTKSYGTRLVKQEGQNGKQVVTYKIKYENGDVTNALISNTEKVNEVINKIIIIGTKSAISIDPSTIPTSGDWVWPTLQPSKVSSGYGWRWGSFHDAIDITGTGHGSPIFSANNGVVYRVFYEPIGGYQVIIAHENEIYTWYAHLSAQYVKAGDVVKRGQKIGAMGCTGSACTGTHLHFATYKGPPGRGGKHFNPYTIYR
ncbi:MAG: peptidoglycan DD-metalloendopeptidase family protein [Bacilli bacterium]|nr:peptidoglycan DD-metalloendopeptidase family protein [Bacilli bacterium]